MGWRRASGRLDDDAQVLGELALADELVEGAGPEAGLLGLLGRRRHRVDGPVVGSQATDVGAVVDTDGGRPSGRPAPPGAPRGHRLRASSRSAERTSSSTGTSSSTASSAPRISSGP